MGSRERPITIVGAVVASAALYSACFPPLGLHFLAWVALAPLLLALARLSWWEGFGVGCIWSLMVGLGTSSWLPAMISEYFGVSQATGWMAAAGATLGTGFLYGVFGLVTATLSRGLVIDPWRAALVWGACEYARTMGPIANPWVLSGYTQDPASSVAQSADVWGVVGLGMLVMAVNAGVASAMEGRLPGRWKWVRPVSVLSVLAIVIAYGSSRKTGIPSGAEGVEVVLVQSATPRLQRFDDRYRGAKLAHVLDLVARAAGTSADVVFLPELALDVPLDEQTAEGRALLRIAEQGNVEVLAGAPARVGESPATGMFNSFFLLRMDRVADRYDKVSLTPFSERKPFRGWLEWGRDEYATGVSRRPLSSRMGGVGVLLCGEVMFGRHAREAVRLGARILSNPANDSWFGSESAARMQLDVAAMRAVETRRPLVRPTMTGVTAVIDAAGRVVVEAPFGRPALLRANVTPESSETAYVRLGDWAGAVSALATLVLVLGRLLASGP